jgi:hypothetical protein
MSKFVAKKINANKYALFEDGNEFAHLIHVPGDEWLLSTLNVDLKRLFDATVFAADATLQAILWAIRAMLDHLKLIAERLAEANEAETRSAKFAATFKPVVNPRNGKVAFVPRKAVLA